MQKCPKKGGPERRLQTGGEGGESQGRTVNDNFSYRPLRSKAVASVKFVLRLRYKCFCTVRRVRLGPWIGLATRAIGAVSRTESHGPVAIFLTSRRALRVADLPMQRPPPIFFLDGFTKKKKLAVLMNFQRYPV